MSNLTEFLLARIAEDEAAARRATSETWTYHDGGDIMAGYQPVTLCGFDSAGSLQESIEPWNAEHIVRHDPARVLAECEAKRRIVEALEYARQRKDVYNREYALGRLTTEDDLRARSRSNARWGGLDIAAHALALPYADHPDYDEEWRL